MRDNITMKILHVTQNYYPSQGGTQHTMKKVSENLQARFNDTVTVYTTNSYYGPNSKVYRKIEKQEESINGVQVKRFDFLRAHKPALQLLTKTSLKLRGRGLPAELSELAVGPVSVSMKKALLSATADVICASSVHYRFADYGIYRKHGKGAKPFVLYGALHLASEYIPPRYLQRIQAADHYIANTMYEKEFIVGKGIAEQKISVAGAATDILEHAATFSATGDKKKELNIDEHRKVVLCISRQESFKGLPVLLDAFKKLQATGENISLVIAGAAGNYSGALRQAMKEINNLHVCTDVSMETKCSLLETADVVVLPSREESFGVVFLEAWSFKKPVIGAGIGAIASLIDQQVDGDLFMPDNAADLAQRIKNILSDNARAMKMGEAGYKKVQCSYTWDKITAVFRNAYLQAIETFNKNKH